MNKNNKYIIIGAGGHAAVLADALLAGGAQILGFTDADSNHTGKSILGLKVLGNDSVVGEFKAQDILLVNGIGSVGDTSLRRKIFETFKNRGYHFANVVHPSAIVSASAQLGEGVQIMAGVVVQTRANIGDNTILNTGAIVDHDGRIASHVHVAPGVTLSGAVTVGESTHIGTGAVVIQGITIGHHAFIGAGSIIHKDVPDATKALGSPVKLTPISPV